MTAFKDTERLPVHIQNSMANKNNYHYLASLHLIYVKSHHNFMKNLFQAKQLRLRKFNDLIKIT